MSLEEQVCPEERWRNWKILPSKWWREDRRIRSVRKFCSDNTSVVTELTSKSQNNLTECFEEARMAVAVHNKTSSWLEENEKFFLPPVCNKMMHNDQLKVALAD